MKIPPPTERDLAIFEAEARADRASDRFDAEMRGIFDSLERELARLIDSLEDE